MALVVMQCCISGRSVLDCRYAMQRSGFDEIMTSEFLGFLFISKTIIAFSIHNLPSKTRCF